MFISIWKSLRSLPLWVQIWVVGILMPINLISLAFLDHEMGLWVALLAIGGMMPNLPIVLYERGMSKLMSLPHVVIWTPLWILTVYLLTTEVSGGYRIYLWALTIINGLSLYFDFIDTRKWFQGDRAVAGQ